MAPEHGDSPAAVASRRVLTRSAKVWVVQMSAYFSSAVFRRLLAARRPPVQGGGDQVGQQGIEGGVREGLGHGPHRGASAARRVIGGADKIKG
jgi:hypothetical protein